MIREEGVGAKKDDRKTRIISNYFPFYRSTLEIRRFDFKSKGY